MQSPRTVAAPLSKSGGIAFSTAVYRPAPWRDILTSNDFGRLWGELQRLVKAHPLVRKSYRAFLTEDAESGRCAHTDLTQELFVTLLSKARFQFYLDTGMRDADIECEIARIEVTNLLTAELRKRRPESFRLARRVAKILRSSANFTCFDKKAGGAPRRLADCVYALRGWPESKASRPLDELEPLVRLIPMHERDRRLVGCSGDTQVVISTPDLERLIITVLQSCDAPLDVRTLRNFVLSRLPLMDADLVPLESSGDAPQGRKQFELADKRENPEQRLLRLELEREGAKAVNQFLRGLRAAVCGKEKQYRRMLGVLWYYYLSLPHISQLEVAARLHVSDSLVSDYRRRIEQQLRALSFSHIEQARHFEILLHEQVRTLKL